MLTVSEAQSTLLAGVEPLPSVRIRLTESLGYVLAEDVIADIDNPPFDNSAVDGFAVRSADTRGSAPHVPVTLRIVELVSAGAVPAKELSHGECSRIMTGAPVPAGADSIVMKEDTSDSGDVIDILQAAHPGDHVRRAAADVKRGDRVLPAGACIRPGEVAMLAAMGRTEPRVHARPRVAIVTTGDEVVDPSRFPGPGQIRNSNAFALAALVLESGADIHSMIHVCDDLDSTEQAFRSAANISGTADAHVIVTSGGVSVGERDYVKPAVERLGVLSFWRVKMKPGKPIAAGRIGNSLFFGLPGNPASTMVTFELFVRPVLRKLAGYRIMHRPKVNVTLEGPIERHPGREEYVRAAVRVTESGLMAAPTGDQGSGNISSMLGVNALLVLPPETARFEKGDTVPALLLDVPEPDAAAVS